MCKHDNHATNRIAFRVYPGVAIVVDQLSATPCDIPVALEWFGACESLASDCPKAMWSRAKMGAQVKQQEDHAFTNKVYGWHIQ